MSYQGILIPIGGNEDKGIDQLDEYELDFVKDGILSRVVRESGGNDASIKVIPTASSIPVEVGENYMAAFGKLGCSNVTVLDIRTRKDAEEEVTLKHLEEADCIMMSGGDQSRIVEMIGGTRAHEIMKRRFKEEPIVIAGTSAGAMAMSEEMIKGGSSTEALQQGSVEMGSGMGLVPGLIIDSHFIKRGRFGRLTEAVARYPDRLGIGLAEDTGIIIKNRNQCKVIGSGMVILFDPKSLIHNNSGILPEGMPMTLTNLTVHVLANSDSFEIDSRKIEVLPIEADFEY